MSFISIPLIMQRQRRIGEGIIIASGIGMTVLGNMLGIYLIAYGGLAIAGLGVISIFWR